LCDNEPLRLKMANAAKSRTLESFSSKDITGELVKFYSEYVPVGPEVRGQRAEVGNREINVSSQSCPI